MKLATVARRPARVLLALMLGLTGAARAQHPAESYDSVFNQLRSLAPRTDRVAPVRDLTLRRDAALFHLAEGRLYLLTSVSGRTVGAAFVGTGAVTFVPPLAIERHQLRRVLGDSTVTGPIRAAVFVFADSTLEELERHLSFSTGQRDGAAADRVGDALGFLVSGRERQADPSLMAALLNGERSGYFAGYVKRARGDDVMIVIDPLEAEQVQLLRRGRLEGQRVETVSQFPRAEPHGAEQSPPGEEPMPLRLEAYRIEARVDDTYDFSASATVRFTGRRDSVHWARFTLFSELRVDSVVSESGAPLAYHRDSRSPELWVRFDPPVRRDEPRSFRLVYHGDLIEHGSLMDRFLPPRWSAERRRMPPINDSWSFIRSTTTWFPRHGLRQPAEMDLTFRTPRRMRFASIGRRVESRTEGDELVTRWVTERPTWVASFNVGPFDTLEITDPRIPPVTVYINREAHRYVHEVIAHARNPQEYVGGDMANSLSFFATTFGPPLFERYYATEIPYWHGQAFPGLIHLSWWTFLGLSERGADESFRAHEMAHQWWGIGVEPASYRDWWLAEGFAEFAGLWYMQFILQNNENYFRQLRESREELHRVRHEAAPLGVGLRAAENRQGRYSLVVYQKGAWVLQMLRNLFLDTRTMSDERFGRMMQDFYQTYRGRRASTADFQRVVEHHLGRPMDWFFRQWVEGTAIPTYVLSWRADRQADGRYLLRLRVRQEDAPEDFAMFVPLLIEFEGGGQAIVRVTVQGRVTEAQLTLPAEPVRLELNPLESVLAAVREERWR